MPPVLPAASPLMPPDDRANRWMYTIVHMLTGHGASGCIGGVAFDVWNWHVEAWGYSAQQH